MLTSNNSVIFVIIEGKPHCYWRAYTSKSFMGISYQRFLDDIWFGIDKRGNQFHIDGYVIEFDSHVIKEFEDKKITGMVGKIV